MSSFYYRFLEHLLDLKFDEASCINHMQQFSLDKELAKLINTSKELNQLRSLLVGATDIPSALFDQTLQHLNQQQNKITDFYENWFVKHHIMGDEQAYKNPDVIIVLGCNKKMLDLRINDAITYFKMYPNAYAVLSGGGFSTIKTESEFMLEMVKKNNIKNNVLQESISMETLGNALFTKLLLKDNNILTPNLKLLVITSQFHAPRSLYYFNTIYNYAQQYKIAVKGVHTTDDNIRQLTLHELLSEHQAQSTIDIFESNKKNPLDDTAILVKLFQYNNLYKNRYDILRKFMSIANQ